MIKSIIKCAFALLVTLSATSIVAQPHKADVKKKASSPKEYAQMRTDKMDKVVVLTDKQKTEIFNFYLKQAEARATAKAAPAPQGEVDPAAKKAEFAKKMAENKAQLQKILTPEQYTKWEAAVAKHKAEMKAKRASQCGSACGDCTKKCECPKCDCKQDCAKQGDCPKSSCCQKNCPKQGNCAKADSCKKDCAKQGSCANVANCKMDCPKGDCPKSDCAKKECTKQVCPKK